MTLTTPPYGNNFCRFSGLSGYLLGFCLFGLGLATRFLLMDVLPPRGFPFLTFFPSVMLTAYLAGLLPGLMVSALSIFSAWFFFIAPPGQLTEISRSDLIALIFFAVVLIVDCIIVHLMTSALARLGWTSDQLGKSETRLRLVLDNLFVYVGILDLNGILREINDAPLQIIGLRREDVLDKPLSETAWWADADERRKLQQAIAAAAAGNAVRYDAVIRRSTSERLTIDLQIAPLREGRDGSISALVVSAVDVSERVGALAELNRSRTDAIAAARRAESERGILDAVFNAVPAGIIVADANGKLLNMNRANQQIWGLAPYSGEVEEYAEWKGWWADGSARHGTRILPHEWGLARSLKGENCLEIVEIEPFGSPGERRLTLLSAAPVLDAAGEVQGGVVAQVDITARMEAEQALRESEYRLALALKAGGTAVWELDVGRQELLPADAQLFGMLGYAPHELSLWAQWIALVHEEDRQMILDLVNNVIEGQRESYWAELRMYAKDGSWRWILSQAIAAEHDAEGRATRLVGTHSDITERKAAEQRVRDAALHDPLTGLPNRALVFEYGGHLLAAARRRHGNGALLFVDLDRFKPINDIYGHQVGDLVLQEVANRLRACTRQEDLVGRLGGDEFIILLPHLDDARFRTSVVAQHVVDSISRPFQIGSLELSLTPSIGISYYPEHAADVGALIHAADLAMYQVKQSGRANFHVYSPELDVRAEAVYSLEARLKRAIKHGGFALHYQPVVDIETGKMIGAEALVRLEDNDENAVGPQHFIPVAESAGLIGEIGEWVIAEACRQHRAWLAEGLCITIAVNVSPLQFRQAGFADRLGTILRAMRVDPKYLQLEVTESMIMESLDEAVDILTRIKMLGVKVALDDFGTGYSSLSRLSSLPLDKLKVDQSFVRGIENDPASRAVTDAIIALGHSLRLDVIGEGIESEPALRYLQEHGCRQAQGYWFSQPLQAADFADWCRERETA